MPAKVIELPIFPYLVMEKIGSSEIDYTTILNDPSLLEVYNDINTLAHEIQKLIALQIIVTKKTYSVEEGDDFTLTLTKRGLGMLKNSKLDHLSI